MSTTPEAAKRYRDAQRLTIDRRRLLSALRQATRADPDFALAAVDLSALGGGGLVSSAARLFAWERHHLDVVLAVADGDSWRAADLLRDHLVAVVCDPIATTAVLGICGALDLADVLDRRPDCHPRVDPGLADG